MSDKSKIVKIPKWVKIVGMNDKAYIRRYAEAMRIEVNTRHLKDNRNATTE